MGVGKKLADFSMAKIATLESHLSGALKPVAPRQEFVHGLGHRIQAGNRTTVTGQFFNWPTLAMLIAGLVSLAVFLAMVARALLALMKKRAM
jgi:hypothetical protein